MGLWLFTTGTYPFFFSLLLQCLASKSSQLKILLKSVQTAQICGGGMSELCVIRAFVCKLPGVGTWSGKLGLLRCGGSHSSFPCLLHSRASLSSEIKAVQDCVVVCAIKAAKMGEQSCTNYCFISFQRN